MKKFVILVLFGLYSAGTVHAQSGTVGKLNWSITDGKLTITGNDVIPDCGIGTAFNPPWDDYKDIITSIDIGGGVTRIGNNAFSGFKEVVSVSIFGTVFTIGEYVFSDCLQLISVYLPASLTTIETHAFFRCRKLSSISIPGSVTSIGDNAFVGCSEMTSISVDDTNPAYSSDDGVLFNKAKTILIAAPAGKQGSYTIPEPVEIITSMAFNGCAGLTSVSFPSTLTTIGNQSFMLCTGLTSLTFPSSLTTINQFAFDSCTGLVSITIPASTTTIGIEAFNSCSNLKEVINLCSTPQGGSPYGKIFSNSIYNSCKLIVSSGSVEDYRKAADWLSFQNIVAFDAEITLGYKEKYLLTGAITTITATVTGDVTSPDFVTWNNSDETVTTLDDIGTITAIKKGTTVITVSLESIETTCTVTVIQPGKSIIEGTIDNDGKENLRVHLYIKSGENN